MATITDSIALYSSAQNSYLRPEISSRPALSISVRRRLGALPEFRGLRVHSLPKPSPASSNFPKARPFPSTAGIVSQAQDTTLDVPTVTDRTWNSLVLKADGPVLVEFWAPWCGPCRTIHPVVGELAKEYAGKLKCFKLSTDDTPSIATQYGIRSVPTIMIFINGEKKDAIIGAVPKTTLTATIEKFL